MRTWCDEHGEVTDPERHYELDGLLDRVEALRYRGLLADTDALTINDALRAALRAAANPEREDGK